MTELRSAAQEAAEDLFFGQIVIIWARWFVIISGVIVVLWSSNNTSELTTAVLMVVPLIAINFFVHGRYLMERPINQKLLLGLSLVDIIVITIIVLVWQDPNGFLSPYYIFYYPFLLAVAFVFSVRISVPYALLTLILYSVACLVTDFNLVNDSYQLEGLIIRLITMGTIGGLGAFYWRIQRGRRRAAAGQGAEAPASS
jgi:hypothetical protein